MTPSPLLKREIFRKSVHSAGLFLIPILLWNHHVSAALLILFLAGYFLEEYQSRRGKNIPLLTALTERSKRDSEKNHFSLGAILLCLTAIFLPYIFGARIAAIGLTQVFSADAVSTVCGIFWGKKKLPHATDKTWIGSFAYCLTAFIAGLVFVSWPHALVLACVGTVIESFPLSAWDNLLIPLGVCGTAWLFPLV
jgi:dolichol kinase